MEAGIWSVLKGRLSPFARAERAYASQSLSSGETRLLPVLRAIASSHTIKERHMCGVESSRLSRVLRIYSHLLDAFPFPFLFLVLVSH